MILCVYGSRRTANKYQPLGILSGLIASKQITITEAMLHNNWLTNCSKTHNTSEPGNEAYFRSNSKLNYFEVLAWLPVRILQSSTEVFGPPVL